jgi:glycosyltransferase involved in cell wall biosynthesis
LDGGKKTKKIATIHDIIPITNPELVSKMNAFFSNINFKRQVITSDIIITPSYYTKKMILNYYPDMESKIEVVPLGITDNLVSYINNNRKTERNDSDYFVIVGNIEPRKNLETLSKAIKILNERLRSDFKLKVIGKDSVNAAKIKEFCKRKLGNKVEFLGFMDERKKFDLIKNSLALIFPSTYEGFGIPGIESMALGVPTILADNSSLSELAIDDWQLFETMNSEQLSFKLEDIVKKNIPIDFQKESYKLLEKYNWEKIAIETKKIYESIL